MKKALPVLPIALLVLSSAAFAQTPLALAAGRSISVFGEAEVRVVPDQVLISMTAESRGPDLLATQKENDQAIKNLVEYATKTAGLESKYVQTDFTSIEPVYRRCDYDDELAGRCNPLEIVYYRVRKGVQIRLDDLDRYEDLITRSLQLGITSIDNIQFITTELRKHRDKARELAAQAAREKAQAIAETLGVKVVKPININVENYSSFYWHGYSRRGQGAMMQNVIQQAPSQPSGAGDGALALGQINISAIVRVTYKIE